MALVVSATSKTYSGFSPTMIPNCALWFDAADSSALTLSGSTVTVWRDKSGNGFNATASGTPVRSGNGINFNGSAAFTTNYTAVPTVETLFFVGTFTGPFDGFNYGILGPSITRGRYMSVYRNTATDHYFVMGGQGVAGNTGVGGVVLNTRFLGVGTINVPTLTCAINGSPQGNTTSGGNFLNNGLTNIGTPPGGYNWYGTMNEIIVFNSVLTASQIQQVEGYLREKWGLQSAFPAVHPYKSIPVAMRPLTPLDIPECGLWLDAVDPASLTLSNTSGVALWKDKSGRGWNFSQTTSGRYPVYTSNVIGTRQMISFTGAASQGAATQVLDNMSFQLSNSNYSIFMVTNRGGSAPSYTGYNYALKAAPNSDGVLFFGNVPSKDFAVFTGANLDQWNEVSANNPAISTLNSTRILGMVNSNTTYTPYYDGKSMSSKSGGTFAFTGLRIGDAGDPGPRSGQNWNGFIGEIVIHNQSLGTATREQLEGYLAWKWGKVGDLPSTHPFKLAPPLVPAFTPLQIPGCALWLDAADRTTLTLSGSNVTQWNDKSGSGNNANAHTSNPVFTSNVQNGLPGIQFSGGQALSAGNIATGTTFSLFTVLRYTTTSGISMGFWKVQFSSFLRLDAPTGNTVIGQISATGPITPTGTGQLVSVGSPSLITALQSSDTVSSAGYLLAGTNGSVTQYNVTNGPNTNACQSPFTIGALIESNVAYYFMTGFIHEIVFYRGILTTTQRQQVEGYLAAKWGLKTNLPTAHPFKTITP